MKLLNIPKTSSDVIEVGYGGKNSMVPGRMKICNVTILCSRVLDDKDVTWQKLKYGTIIKFDIGRKIPKITFREGDADVVLYGVIPVSITWCLENNEQEVECRIDHYEISNGP